MYKRFFFLLLLLSPIFILAQKKTATSAAYTPTQPTLPKPLKQAKNVILLIGDGMGLTQISGALYSNGNKLNLERFPVAGLQKSYAANDLITDSAASATSFACGVKTNNGAIGMDRDSMPVPSILEEAEAKGLATGMVVTSTITHATPAAFIAHVKSRKSEEEIAEAFLKTEIDFFVGGGEKFFNQRTIDQRNLSDELTKKGYQVADFSKGNLTDLNPDPKQNFAYFSATENPLPVSSGRTYLAPASKMAADFLKVHSDKGFFLMIEGSQIDWGGHGNNSDYIVSETIDFDKAIGLILDFAKADGETLVVVTADHETGGYALNPGSEFGKMSAGFTTAGHTAQLIPVFAYGPGSELFYGTYENTDIYWRMRKALGFENK